MRETYRRKGQEAMKLVRFSSDAQVKVCMLATMSMCASVKALYYIPDVEPRCTERYKDDNA